MNANINLRKGQRYLFYEQAPYHENEISFRANFVAILGQTLIVNAQTLIVNASETGISNRTILSVPLEWITRIETLEDILTVNSVSLTFLPTDVLNIIDSYM